MPAISWASSRIFCQKGWSAGRMSRIPLDAVIILADFIFDFTLLAMFENFELGKWENTDSGYTDYIIKLSRSPITRIETKRTVVSQNKIFIRPQSQLCPTASFNRREIVFF